MAKLKKLIKSDAKSKWYGGIDLEKMIIETFGLEFIEEAQECGEFGFYDFVAKEKSHKQMKELRKGRVQVLRKLVMTLYSHRRNDFCEMEFMHRVEKYLDNLLAKRKYMIEDIITELRGKVSVYDNNDKYGKCNKCNYVKPFCKH